MKLNKSIASLLFGFFFLRLIPAGFSQVKYPGNPPGKAKAYRSANRILLENQVIKMVFETKGTRMYPLSFTDRSNNNISELRSLKWFELTLENGNIFANNAFQLLNKPLINSVNPGKKTGRYADRLAGKTIKASFINPESGLTIEWEATLTDGANYILQKWSFHAKYPLPIIKYTMLEVPASSAKQEGTVDGSPLISKEMFFAIEHPMSRNEITEEKAISYLPRPNPLQPSVISLSPLFPV